MRAASRLHALFAVAISLGAILAVGGCPAKKPKTPACESNDDCKDGLVCIAIERLCRWRLGHRFGLR